MLGCANYIADETWEGPKSSVDNDVYMFNSAKGVGECGTFTFSISA